MRHVNYTLDMIEVMLEYAKEECKLKKGIIRKYKFKLLTSYGNSAQQALDYPCNILFFYALNLNKQAIRRKYR